MPVVEVRTNIAELPAGFEEGIQDVVAETLGRPAEFVFVDIQTGRRLIHGKQPGDIFIIDVKSIGLIDEQSNSHHASAITKFVRKRLRLPEAVVLIEFHPQQPHLVAFDGETLEVKLAHLVLKKN